jgi:chromosome segregation ATPase
VARELLYWLDHKRVDTLLIAVTEGELAWDDDADDFAWSDSTPLPAVLTGRIATEPRWVDVRQHRSSATTSSSSFIDLAAEFAATIRGIPKDDLLSQEVRQQRQALRLAWSAVGSLLVLASLAGHQWKLTAHAERTAVEQKQVAEEQRQNAEAFYTATQRLNSQIAQLTELLSLEKAGKLSIEEQLAKVRFGLTAAETERDRCRGLHERVGADAADAQSRVSQLSAQLDAEQRMSTRALAQVEVLNQQIAALGRQLGTLQEAIEAAEKKDQAAQKSIEDLGQRLNVALAQRVRDLESNASCGKRRL